MSGKGKIAKKHWKEIPKHYPQIFLDEFCIMPNHIHGLIQIKNVETTNLGVSYSEIIKNDLEKNNLIGLQKWKLSLIARIINQFKRTTTIEMKNKKGKVQGSYVITNKKLDPEETMLVLLTQLNKADQTLEMFNRDILKCGKCRKRREY